MQIIALPNIPLIRPGDDLSDLILKSAAGIDLTLTDRDIIVVAQKVVSKAENRFVKLAQVTPSARALELAQITGKPARLVEVILWDTATVIRAVPGLLIVEHKLGFISANAGLDHSNVSAEPSTVLRLPADPDTSARVLRRRIKTRTDVNPPLLIIDSHGRPWRFGTVGVTIGLSGLAPMQNLRGMPDLFDAPLAHTDVGFTDQIAAAASLVMGQAAEGYPVVIVRGLPFQIDEAATAAAVLRPRESDLFR